jgi:hypothetical protein
VIRVVVTHGNSKNWLERLLVLERWAPGRSGPAKLGGTASERDFAPRSRER